MCANSTHGPIRHCSTRIILRAGTCRNVFCTNSRFTFLGSPSPWIPFHMHLDLVQPLYRARSSSKMCAYFLSRTYTALQYAENLRGRPGRRAFCTMSRFTFFGAGSSSKMCANFHSQIYTALPNEQQFTGPSWSVGFLQQLKVYIFGLSFPIDFFSCAHCFGATIVPC